jgi:hypothetical protein
MIARQHREMSALRRHFPREDPGERQDAREERADEAGADAGSIRLKTVPANTRPGART